MSKVYLSRSLFVLGLMLCAGVAWGGNDFCMDCAARWVELPDGSVRTEALCCTTTQDNTCFGGYGQISANVGARCLIYDGQDGDTYCGTNSSIPTGCDELGGGDGGPLDPIDQDPNGCTSSYGWCPPRCSSC